MGVRNRRRGRGVLIALYGVGGLVFLQKWRSRDVQKR